MSADQPDINLQRHKSLYFDNGDIVLAAPTKGYPEKRILFRVDKIYLARNSPVFRDMLSFSPGQGPHDTYDGVPRVDFTDDAEDLQGLLGAMYNAATLPLRRFYPDKPLLLMGTMRLAIKYEVDSIRDLIMRSVEEDWPHDPASYETWLAERRRVIESHPGHWVRRIPEPAAALRFATEFELSKISVGVLYYLAICGTKNHFYPETTGPPSKPIQCVRWHLLDGIDCFRLLRAQEVIKANIPTYERELLRELGQSGCCRTSISDTLKKDMYPDIMQSHSWVIEILRDEEVCDSCVEDVGRRRTFLATWKQRVWEHLRLCTTELSPPWPENTREDV